MHLSVYTLILSLLSGLTFVIGSLFLGFAKFKNPNEKTNVRLRMVGAAMAFAMSLLMIVLEELSSSGNL